MAKKHEEQKAGNLLVPGSPKNHFPSDLPSNLWMYLKLMLFDQDITLSLGSHPEDFEGLGELEIDYSEKDLHGEDCDAERLKTEYGLLAQTYQQVVQRNLGRGWVWGPHGNIMISTGQAQMGSCSDWQLDIYRALCALPNIHCYQICKIRTVWHKAVVVYPKDTWWWRASGIVFDPWFLGNAYAYTVAQWFLWCGPSWKYDCCK